MRLYVLFAGAVLSLIGLNPQQATAQDSLSETVQDTLLPVAQDSLPLTHEDSLWLTTRYKSIEEIVADVNQDSVPDALGDTVMTSGRATVDSGIINMRYLQVFIQNDSTAGISLFTTSLKDTIQAGDSVVVIGTVQQYYGLPQLLVETYKVPDVPTKIPDPIPLEKALKNKTRYAGMLVEGTSTVIEKTDDFHGKSLSVSESDSPENAISIYISSFHKFYRSFKFQNISIGDRVHVKGILSKYDPGDVEETKTYKVLPRKAEDLALKGIPRFYFNIIGIGAIALGIVAAVWMVVLRREVKKQTRKVRRSLKEKEALLQEIHHRVKNNLAVICGLIELQLDSTTDEQARKVLSDSQTRIYSMAMVHERLYQTESLSRIEMGSYIKELVESIGYTFSTNGTDIRLKVDTDATNLAVDQAIPCGLLINELVVNVYKHAFKGKDRGTLKISLHKTGKIVKLVVADDGKGFPKDFDIKKSNSLGMSLIDTFVSQLGGTYDITNSTGTKYQIQFKVKENR